MATTKTSGTKKREVIYRPIEGLVPYARNSRTHSDEQVAQIAASIREFGWTNPLLIDADGGIVAGHGRLLAARHLGMSEAPCIVLDGLSDAQKRALVIADNKLALNAGWDEDLLSSELQGLLEEGFDLSLVGFGDDELSALFADNDDTKGSFLSSPIPAEALEKAWRSWARELADQVKTLQASSYPRQGVTPGFALLKFLGALHEGKDYPRIAYSAFHPEIYSVAGEKFSILEGLERVSDGDLDFRRLEFVCEAEMDVHRILGSPLPFGGARNALDFPALLARDLINEFAPGGNVADPCHGWGGRLIGFLLSSATHYAGTDPAPKTHAGVRRIQDLFAPHVPLAKSIQLANLPAEKWRPRSAGTFDLVLTSPPYFDVEKYEGGEQSRDKFPSYDLWKNGFYAKLIERSFSWLRPGGVFALQIGSQNYPLLNDGKDLARQAGFDVEEVRATHMTNVFAETEEQDGEVVIILRRPKAAKVAEAA